MTKYTRDFIKAILRIAVIAGVLVTLGIMLYRGGEIKTDHNLAGESAKVTCQIHLRREAGMDGEIQKVLLEGDKLTLTGRYCQRYANKGIVEPWVEVKTQEGRIGWVVQRNIRMRLSTKNQSEL